MDDGKVDGVKVESGQVTGEAGLEASDGKIIGTAGTATLGEAKVSEPHTAARELVGKWFTGSLGGSLMPDYSQSELRRRDALKLAIDELNLAQTLPADVIGCASAFAAFIAGPVAEA
ncbi:MAG: hypothetical protein ABL901_01060 [Hyphomicrobiaceae bacterium]